MVVVHHLYSFGSFFFQAVERGDVQLVTEVRTKLSLEAFHRVRIFRLFPLVDFLCVLRCSMSFTYEEGGRSRQRVRRYVLMWLGKGWNLLSKRLENDEAIVGCCI